VFYFTAKPVVVKGKQKTYKVVDHPGGAGILAVRGEEILLVEQFRPAVGKTILELPAGIIDPGETPLAAAQRELLEETGFTAGKWSSLGKVYATPGYSSETIHLFLAEELHPGEQQLDDGEDIAVRTVAISDFLRLLETDQVHDAKTVVAFLRYILRQGWDSGA
jgi:ADP-ribose pyrophosphatase